MGLIGEKDDVLPLPAPASTKHTFQFVLPFEVIPVAQIHVVMGTDHTPYLTWTQNLTDAGLVACLAQALSLVAKKISDAGPPPDKVEPPRIILPGGPWQ